MSFSRFIFVATSSMFCLMPGAWAQDCESALEDALESFTQQRYDMVIVHLAECPTERLLENTKKIIAYEMLALSYFALEKRDLAKQDLNALLDLQPGYAPEAPQYSDGYVEIVSEIKQERADRAKKSSILRNKWFWFGGVAVSSAAVFLFSRKAGEPGLLPEAPDPPDFP